MSSLIGVISSLSTFDREHFLLLGAGGGMASLSISLYSASQVLSSLMICLIDRNRSMTAYSTSTKIFVQLYAGDGGVIEPVEACADIA